MRRLILVITLAACTSGPRDTDAQQANDSRVPKGGDKSLMTAVLEVHGRMHQRFTATERMRTAIAVSDLLGAQREAQVVADLDEPDLLPVWKPYVEEIRASARAVVATHDPVAAARSMATLGRACAGCHQAAKAKPVVPRAEPPPSQPGLRGTMANHHWGAGLMWQGVVLPSDDRWQEGARALAAAPLTITAERDEPPHEIGIADDVARIRMLARRAETTGALDDRAELYGELLGTCVRCHQTIRDR